MDQQVWPTTRRDDVKSPLMGRIRMIGGILACVVAGVCLIAAVTATAIVLRGSSSASGAGNGSLLSPTQMPNRGTTQPTCDAPGKPACPAILTWIPLKSQAPGDILAAVRQSTLFNVDRSGGGDYISDLSHLGTPVFVHGLSAPGGPVEPDFYVIPRPFRNRRNGVG
jgi:hypothetical protein